MNIDDIVRDFGNLYCEFGDGYECRLNTMFDEYKLHCKYLHQRPMVRKSFSKSFSMAFPSVYKEKGKWGYIVFKGVRLNPEKTRYGKHEIDFYIRHRDWLKSSTH